MTTANSTNKPNSKAESESVSKRAAEHMHERIDQAAEKGEQFERTLHEQSADAQAKARELGDRVSTAARNNPWMAIGGSVALGIVIGALMSRR